MSTGGPSLRRRASNATGLEPAWCRVVWKQPLASARVNAHAHACARQTWTMAPRCVTKRRKSFCSSGSSIPNACSISATIPSCSPVSDCAFSMLAVRCTGRSSPLDDKRDTISIVSRAAPACSASDSHVHISVAIRLECGSARSACMASRRKLRLPSSSLSLNAAPPP
eukprot:350662-Rhodomonas_salina.1